jgi:ketosteroid isomerase-like protein
MTARAGPHSPYGRHGRPTAAELVAAVAEFLDADVRGATNGQVNFHARVAANALRIVERELGAEATGAAAAGAVNESALADAIRNGDFDGRDDDVVTALRTLVFDRLEVAHPGYALASVADRLFSAIEAGDVDAVAAMWSDDIVVWHAGDELACDKDRAIRVIEWFVSVTADRHYDVLDRRFFGGGFVQQHVLHGLARDGTSYSLRIGIIIAVGRDGLITRIDEYFDPADLAPLLDQQSA